MLALRFAAVLALVFWVGGLAALGMVAAPVIFDIAGAQGAEGRSMAGVTFGAILGRFTVATYVCAAVIVASLAARAVLGPRPRLFAFRLLAAAAMTAATVWSGVVLGPRIQQAQRSLGTSPSTLAENDPRRAEFNSLHSMSRSVQLVPLVVGLALLFFELKD